MKKLKNKIAFVLALLIVAGTIESYADIVYKTQISFGRKSRKCYGVGICFIHTELLTNSSVRLSGNETTLELDIPFETTKGSENLFSGSTFVIMEDVEISPEVQKMLGASKPLTIKPGNYPFDKTESGYTIHFAQ